MATIDLSILTVGFNSASHLEKCLASLDTDLARPNVEMLFINNGKDRSEDLVERMAQQVRIVPSQGNIGFGRACNLLASHAKGHLFLLLNPDTEVRPDAIEALVQAAIKRPDFAILGAMTLTKRDGSQHFPQLKLPGLGSLARGLIGRTAFAFPPAQSGSLIPVDCISGGCMMVRREDWHQLGGFDEAFFLYAEDLDLCRRATDAGMRLAINPEAQVYHDIGSGDFFSPNRLMLQMRGNAHYYRKHFSPTYAFACLGMLWLTGLVRFIIGGLIGLGSTKYRAMSIGYKDLTLHPWKWWHGYFRPSIVDDTSNNRSHKH
ncbi:MAG: glycosyltransferase family 2 protein [Erythrobacter sp.]